MSTDNLQGSNEKKILTKNSHLRYGYYDALFDAVSDLFLSLSMLWHLNETSQLKAWRDFEVTTTVLED